MSYHQHLVFCLPVKMHTKRGFRNFDQQHSNSPSQSNDIGFKANPSKQAHLKLPFVFLHIFSWPQSDKPSRHSFRSAEIQKGAVHSLI